MSQKALLFKDEETAERIMVSENPKEHKRVGIYREWYKEGYVGK